MQKESEGGVDAEEGHGLGLVMDLEESEGIGDVMLEPVREEEM